jgi:hypothetical protein
MVVNFSAASVGLIHSIATVGPQKLLTLTADILALGRPCVPEVVAPLASALSLVSGDGGPDSPVITLDAGSSHEEQHELLAATSTLESAASPSPVLDDVVAPSLLTPSAASRHLPLELHGSPVRATIWHRPTSRLGDNRRSSRLNRGANYISIVDRAMQRKKELREGDGSKPPPRKGELPADELIVLAMEENSPLPDRDVLSLAATCDIPAVELRQGTGPTTSPAASP